MEDFPVRARRTPGLPRTAVRPDNPGLPPIDPEEPVPDDPGPLLPDDPGDLPPAPHEPSPFTEPAPSSPEPEPEPV